MQPRRRLLVAAMLLWGCGSFLTANAFALQQQVERPGQRETARPDRRRSSPERAKAVEAICKHLGIGPASVVADIGAGNGVDTWVFAKVVGPEGVVYSEEISEEKVNQIRHEAEKRGLKQVHAILGKVDDPCLPPNSVDMAYMHYVYHHLTKPREMLRGIWRGLKPGGYFVVVDRHRGTLKDWIPRQQRGNRHFWIAETTVVREAREEGFLFVECAEKLWPGNPDQFVLVFQRPNNLPRPGSDPDSMEPLNLQKLREAVLASKPSFEFPVIIALGEARGLIPDIVQHAGGRGVDVVLEEWATRRDERPPLPQEVDIPAVLTDDGHVAIEAEKVDVVFFLDTYHLLFHHETLLHDLFAKLVGGGKVYVLDRRAAKLYEHRLTSHHRQIHPELVKQEMQAAGFRFVSELPAPASDRFLLVFEKP